MASAAPTANFPILYNDLVPLSSIEHKTWKARPLETIKGVGETHAIPLTIDEFVPASRHYPIIFSVGDQPVPLAMMALNEGMNMFIGADGKFTRPGYAPAYLRRYPFLLTRLQPDSDELSLCFDPSTGTFGETEEGERLFNDDGQPSDMVKAALNFCEDFEQSAQRTGQFMAEVREMGLLMDGELAIQQEGAENPFIYRGFQMIDEEKLRELRGDQLRKISQNGMLPLLYAHLFSLQLARDIFAMQVEAGKVPGLTANAAPSA